MIKNAKYLCSYVEIDKCPIDNKKIFAFIGRSNVGKSSLINTLCNHKNLAKTSVTPGKTKMINYFEINNLFYFVDFPGYGYAKIAKSQRALWTENLFKYVNHIKLIKQVFVLVDISIPFQIIDIDFINKLGKREIPFVIIFTKSDKELQSQMQKNMNGFFSELLKTWETLPLYFITSSRKKNGINGILQFLEKEIQVN